MGTVNTMSVLRMFTKVRTTAVLSCHFILKPTYTNLSLKGMLPCDYRPKIICKSGKVHIKLGMKLSKINVFVENKIH
jgi:hypothetical protein